MSAAQPTVGIDLGTTYSLIAYLDDAGRPVTIPNEAGDLLTPSAVFVDEDEIIVGKEAVRASVINLAAYAECFKRDMGSVAFRRKVCDRQLPPEVLGAGTGTTEARCGASLGVVPHGRDYRSGLFRRIAAAEHPDGRAIGRPGGAGHRQRTNRGRHLVRLPGARSTRLARPKMCRGRGCWSTISAEGPLM